MCELFYNCFSHSCVRLVTLFTASIFLISSSAQADPPSSGVFSNGVVADLSSQTIYLSTANGAVSSIDMTNGNILWNSGVSGLPLALSGQQLVLQEDSAVPGPLLKLHVIDARNGALMGNYEASLPDSVKVLIDDRLGESFKIITVVDGDDVSFLWTYKKQLMQGIVSETQSMHKTELSGALQLDLGKQILVEVRLRDAPSPAVIIPNAQPGERIAQLSGNQYFSFSREQILASQRVRDPDFNQYIWMFYSASNQLLGSIVNHLSRADFMLVDNRQLVYLSLPYYWDQHKGKGLESFPLSLRSFDLTAKKRLWDVSIRDTRYTGPFPR